MPQLKIRFTGGYAYVFDKNYRSVTVGSIRADLDGLPKGYREHHFVMMLKEGNVDWGSTTVGMPGFAVWGPLSGCHVEVRTDGVDPSGPLVVPRKKRDPGQGVPSDWNDWIWVVDLAGFHTGAALRRDWRKLLSARFLFRAGTIRPVEGIGDVEFLRPDGQLDRTQAAATTIEYSLDFRNFADIEITGSRKGVIRLLPPTSGGAVELVAVDPLDHRIGSDAQDDFPAHYALIKGVGKDQRIKARQGPHTGAPGEACIPSRFRGD